MDAEKYLKYESGRIPFSEMKFINPEILTRYLKKGIERRLKLSHENKLAEELMDAVKHPNRKVEDYMHKLIDIDKNNSVLSRISFRNINNELTPFVIIILKNFDIIKFPEMQEMLRIIYMVFENFKPEFICFFEINKNLSDNTIEVEDNFVTGHIKSIQGLQKPDSYDKVSLKKMNDLKFYEKYNEEYKTANENAMFANERIIPEEEFEFYLSEGTVFEINVKGNYAGIYTFHKTQMNYLEGYYVIEQVLFQEFRGQNLAAAVQRKAIDSIEAEDHEFIYGTIHPDNKASLKTALKCGRHISGSYYKLKF